MTADHVAVTPYNNAAYDVERLLDTLDVLTYTITATETTGVTLLGPDAALVTQRKSFEGTFEGKPVPARVFSSALWVRQDGEWREKLYQETEIAE